MVNCILKQTDSLFLFFSLFLLFPLVYILDCIFNFFVHSLHFSLFRVLPCLFLKPCFMEAISSASFLILFKDFVVAKVFLRSLDCF